MTIQYPFAIDGEGRLRHIDQVSPFPYSCLSCEEPMIAKRGKVKAHHFAHKATQCDPDRALHDTAQALIMNAYNEAKERSERYYTHFLCPRCKRNAKFNLVRPGRLIRKEAGDKVKGTRPDLALIEANGQNAGLIEIVVTHDLEEGTQAAYEQLELTVFKTRPSWETLLTYQDEVAVDPDSLNLPLCRECRDATEAMRQEVDRFLDALTVTSDKPLPDSFLLPRNDYREGQKRWLRALYAYGARFRHGKNFLYLLGSKRRNWALNFLPLYQDEKDGVVSVWISNDMRRALETEKGDLSYEVVKTRIENALTKVGEIEWWSDAN